MGQINANQLYELVHRFHPLLYEAYHQFALNDLTLYATWCRTICNDMNSVHSLPSFWFEVPTECMIVPLPKTVFSYSQFRSMFSQICVFNMQLEQINASNALDSAQYWRDAKTRLEAIQGVDVMLWSYNLERIGERIQRLRLVLYLTLPFNRFLLPQVSLLIFTCFCLAC